MSRFQPKPSPIIRLASALLLLSIALLPAGGCDYARMTDDEAVNTYGKKMPAMPSHTVPVDGGIEDLRSADPKTLVNPVPSTLQSLEMGRLAYSYFCIHCHGPLADGNGTVGQSFSPLPTDLRTPAVQSQSDGELFAKISLGYKRHPPLALTVATNDRWAVINYLRFLSSATGIQP